MKHSFRRIIAISCAALLLVMAGCAGNPPAATTAPSAPAADGTKTSQAPGGEQVVLQVSQWHTLEEQFNKPFMEIVADFEAANPDIKIEPVEIAWGGHH